MGKGSASIRRQDGGASETPRGALHAVALGLVGLQQRRELCLEGVLRGHDVAEGRDELLLLQLVLDGKPQRGELLEIRSRIELHLFEFREHRE